MTSSGLLYIAAALAGVLMAVSASLILGAVLLVAGGCMAAAARLYPQKEKQNEHTEEKES